MVVHCKLADFDRRRARASCRPPDCYCGATSHKHVPNRRFGRVAIMALGCYSSIHAWIQQYETADSTGKKLKGKHNVSLESALREIRATGTPFFRHSPR